LGVPPLSVTVNENVKLVFAATAGATNVGDAADVLLNETAVPPVCDHAYEATVPSGSLLPEPFSVTVAPAVTV
ncbi:MAG TPA: hypothetical protein VJ011_06875, partial [Steroidobacteraceae bacterium]|nr:hypothetical protein [Steroidobacteraceae bacterium]